MNSLNQATTCTSQDCGGTDAKCAAGCKSSTKTRMTINPSQSLMNRINAIDLTMVKMKLMDSKEGQGWTQEQADEIERRYKRFLFLHVTIDDFPIVPTKDIDTMWHQHILDTMAYQEDCERIFEQFVHHFPYFGMRGEQGQESLGTILPSNLRSLSKNVRRVLLIVISRMH